MSVCFSFPLASSLVNFSGGRRRDVRVKDREADKAGRASVRNAKKKRPRSCRGKIEGASKLVSNQTGRRVVFKLKLTGRERARRSLKGARTFELSHSPFPGALAVASVVSRCRQGFLTSGSDASLARPSPSPVRKRVTMNFLACDTIAGTQWREPCGLYTRLPLSPTALHEGRARGSHLRRSIRARRSRVFAGVRA